VTRSDTFSSIDADRARDTPIEEKRVATRHVSLAASSHGPAVQGDLPRPLAHTRAHEVRRLALTKVEAAASLGVSVDTLERYVWPELRIVRMGRLQLAPVSELERWVDRNASRWDQR
jgi:hypothetical protein